jgi:flagellar biogenesis protein FliO
MRLGGIVADCGGRFNTAYTAAVGRANGRLRIWTSVIIILLSAKTPGFAQATNALTLHSDLPEVGLSAIRAFAALALVLAIFFGGVWLYRNGQRLAWRKSGPPRLSILESRPLGNRFALYVVGYEQQRMLIGSSPAGLSLLSQLPAAAEGPEQPVAPQESASFTQCLQQVLRRK